MPKKIEVALELLESAIDSYKSSKYFSALHLAGAAEEIFGKYVRASGNIDALTEFATAMHNLELTGVEEVTIKNSKTYLNLAKNSVKHMNNLNDENININANIEAKEMIRRAISNSRRLGINPTATILQYYLF